VLSLEFVRDGWVVGQSAARAAPSNSEGRIRRLTLPAAPLPSRPIRGTCKNYGGPTGPGETLLRSGCWGPPS